VGTNFDYSIRSAPSCEWLSGGNVAERLPSLTIAVRLQLQYDFPRYVGFGFSGGVILYPGVRLYSQRCWPGSCSRRRLPKTQARRLWSAGLRPQLGQLPDLHGSNLAGRLRGLPNRRYSSDD
jgi:hypothetical protein